MSSDGSGYWEASAVVTALLFPLTIGYERFQVWRSEKAEVKAVLLGIKTEIESGLKRYKPIADVVSTLKDGEPYPSYWRATFDYFSIYHGNTSVIGKIKKHALRESIVEAYTHLKGHIENFSFNNDMLKDYEQFIISSEFLDPKNPAVVEHIKNSYVEGLCNYGSSLRDSHFEIRKATSRALNEINIYLKVKGISPLDEVEPNKITGKGVDVVDLGRTLKS